jgi:REP-associated tyrosine transposase
VLTNSARSSSPAGKREGARRPKKDGAKLRHAERAPLAERDPAHVTLRAVHGAANLRLPAAYEVVVAAIRAARERGHVRVVHFSVQPQHLHLIVEANGAGSLARGVNRIERRLWSDRYPGAAYR